MRPAKTVGTSFCLRAGKAGGCFAEYQVRMLLARLCRCAARLEILSVIGSTDGSVRFRFKKKGVAVEADPSKSDYLKPSVGERNGSLGQLMIERRCNGYGASLMN